jgi:hypothetical protein
MGFPPKVRFAADSLLEESGFEPLVPLTLNQANAGEREEKIAMSPLRCIG